MALLDTIELLPSDVSIGDLGHDDFHDWIHVGLKDLKTVLTALDGSAVKLTGNQTIGGTKTFSAQLNIATPIANTHATTKLYVDNIASEKSDTGHTHSINNVAGLQTALDAKAEDSGLVHLDGSETITGQKIFATSPRLTPTSTAGYSWVASDSSGNGQWVAIASTAEDGTVPWANITGRPSTFPIEAHTHTLSDITDLDTAGVVAGIGLTGGGDLTSPINIAVDFGSGIGKVVQGNDSRLTNTRTPTDNTVTTSKITDANVTVAKIATGARPYDFSYIQSLDTRAVGYGEMLYGIRIERTITITSIRYRLGTADASGTTTCEIRKASTPTGTPTVISGTSGTATTNPTAITGSLTISAGEYIWVYTSAIGTTPGKGLIAEIFAYLS